MMAWSNQPTGVWAFPVTDGWTAGRKKEEYLSHTPPKLHQKLIQPYTLSYSAGQGWWWWGGRRVISLVQSSKKRATKYGGEIGNDRGWIFSLWVHLKLLCKHYGHISASTEREKKKKKHDDRTGRCTKGKTTSSIPLFT